MIIACDLEGLKMTSHCLRQIRNFANDILNNVCSCEWMLNYYVKFGVVSKEVYLRSDILHDVIDEH